MDKEGPWYAKHISDMFALLEPYEFVPEKWHLNILFSSTRGF